MKTFRHFTFVVACAFVALPAFAVSAQQVDNHAVPVGRGANQQGFKQVGPCAANIPIVGDGASADPKCLPNQSANTVWAGPSSGAAAAPSFRQLQAADITGLTPGRTSLTGAATFYVNPNGSSANCNGVTCGAGSDTTGDGSLATPFATLTKAYDTLRNSYDLKGNVATIQLADGTYTPSTQLFGSMLSGQVGPSGLIVQGNCTTPQNVLLQPAAGAGPAILAAYGTSMTIQCMWGDQTNQRSVFPSGGDIFSVFHGGAIIFGEKMIFGCNFVGFNAISVAWSGAYVEFGFDFTNNVQLCQVNTTASYSSGGTTMTVASGSNIVRGMGFVPGSAFPHDAFVASISGATVTLGCIITSPCTFAANGSGAAVSFVGGGQFFLQAGLGAIVNVAANGQSDYSIINTLQNYPFYQSGYYQGYLGVQSLWQAMTFVNYAQASGACFSNAGLSGFDSGSYGVPYLPCLYGLHPSPTTTFTAGSDTITVSSAAGIVAGMVVNQSIDLLGTWPAGSSTITLNSASQVVVGSRFWGDGILSGAAARVNNVSGNVITMDACGGGPKCVSGYPTYLSGASSLLHFSDVVSYLPVGTTVKSISGTTVKLSNPAIANSGTVTLRFSGSNTGGAQYQ